MLQSRTLAALLRASRGGGVQPNRPVRVVRLFFRCQTAVSSSGSADVAFLKTAVSFRPATRKIQTCNTRDSNLQYERFQACNTRTQIKRGRKRTGWSDKCLEAPHLKAVCTVRRVAGIEVRRVEVQVQAADAVDRRRPAIPVVADVPQRSLAAAAVARGSYRASSLFPYSLGKCPSLSCRYRLSFDTVRRLTNDSPAGMISGLLNLSSALPAAGTGSTHTGTPGPPCPVIYIPNSFRSPFGKDAATRS